MREHVLEKNTKSVAGQWFHEEITLKRVIIQPNQQKPGTEMGLYQQRLWPFGPNRTESGWNKGWILEFWDWAGLDIELFGSKDALFLMKRKEWPQGMPDILTSTPTTTSQRAQLFLLCLRGWGSILGFSGPDCPHWVPQGWGHCLVLWDQKADCEAEEDYSWDLKSNGVCLSRCSPCLGPTNPIWDLPVPFYPTLSHQCILEPLICLVSQVQCRRGIFLQDESYFESHPYLINKTFNFLIFKK